MTDGSLQDQINGVGNFLAAAGGLGTAAYGLVDVSKAFAGGMSNPGFGYISKAVEPLLDGTADPAGGQAPAAFGKDKVIATLRANWLNGVAKADQKAIAKSLIRLRLSAGNAVQLATATGVNGDELKALAQRIANGEPLSAQDMNVLGRFDAVISAILDLGYERADQLYRNAAKGAAALVAVVLAAIGGGLIYFQSMATPDVPSYLSSHEFLLALVIGVISTPLAPVAKDLSTALATAVKAVGAAKR